VEEQTDKTFTKNVSIVLALLVVFTIFIIFLARDLGHKEYLDENPSRATTAEERISPVADVYTGEAGAAALEAAAASPVVEQAVAFDGSLDGEMIYSSVCGVCHVTGAAGAPIPGQDAWLQRAEKGLDALTLSAINGLNAMPARGGRSDLSDEQMKAAVEFMLQ
jgi:cytochrome c5